MRQVTVLNNQSLFDIAIQEYGTIEAVFDLAMANGLSVTDTLTAGQVLNVPEVDPAVVQSEIVEYYRRNNIKPVSGDYDLSMFETYETNFNDMKLLFTWGHKDYDGNPMTVTVNKLSGTPDQKGRPILKHLLRVKLSDPTFLSRVKNPVLYIDRRRRRTGKNDKNSNRMSGYTHPKKGQWNGRIFEIPLTSDVQIIDIKPENFFYFTTYNLNVRGEGSAATAADSSYAYTDLAFRIKYELGGKQYDTGHIGKLRLTASYRDIGMSKDHEKNYVVLSYKRI